MFRALSEGDVSVLENFGIVNMEPGGFKGWARHDGEAKRPFLALDEIADLIGMDAQVGTQPSLITAQNAGIPSFLTQYLDPKLIEVLVSPNKAAEILGEQRKGDWTTTVATFEMVEATGGTSSYDDYGTNGKSDINTQFENRQSYYYQTFTEYGERAMATYALAKIDYVSRLNISSAINLNKFQNQTYFFGVQNLENYGLLNDPALPNPLTPAVKVAGGTGWQKALPTEILADVQSMFADLQARNKGLTDLNTKMTLGLSATVATWLANTNQFAVSAMGLIKGTFENLRVVTATEYTQGSVNSCQLILDQVDGQEVGFTGFNEKMRAHRIIPSDSSFRQKKSQGTWGAVLTYPAGFSGMIGI